MERTEAKAVAKTVRIAPRKTRLIIDLIRGKNVDEALVIKRIKFDSRGRTGRNDHKTSHITVIVAEK